MSIVHSVSDITSILSNIIRENITPQNVWVNGKVSSKTPSKGDLPDFFILEDAKNDDKIECVIYKENAHLFEVLLHPKTMWLSMVGLSFFESKSEYRFAVTGIKRLQLS